MDTSQIVWIIVAVVVVLIIIGIIARMAGRKKAVRNREEAGRIRAEEQETQLQARERENSAQRAKADADAAELKSKERDIEAQRLQAEAKDAEVAADRKRMDADQQSAAAREQQQASEERMRHADKLDPDAGKDGSRAPAGDAKGRRADGAATRKPVDDRGRDDRDERAGGSAESGRRQDAAPMAGEPRGAGDRDVHGDDRARQEHAGDPVADRGRDDRGQRAGTAGERVAGNQNDVHGDRVREERAGEPVADRGPDERIRRSGTAEESVGGQQGEAHGDRVRQERAGEPGESGRRQDAAPVVGDPLATDRPDAYGEAAAQRAERGGGQNAAAVDGLDTEDLDAEDVDPKGRHGDVPKHRD